MALSFSVVINTYNRAKLLARALESLRYLRHPRFEVIVVNGPSTDETAALLEAYRGAVRIGHCAAANLSMSRNVGIATAQGEVVCFMDDDAVPEPDWLCQLEAGYADARVGAVGGFIRDHTGVTFQSKVLVCDRYADSYAFESVEEAGVVEAPHADRYLALTGTNSSFRRQALLEIGGFDEEYAYFLDETDVIVRLVDAGYKIKVCPAAEVHHKYAESHLRTATRVPKSLYYPVRSKTYFALKHRRNGQPLDDVFAYLREHARRVRHDHQWLLDNGLIDQVAYERLLDDIQRGAADGVHDAFARLDGLAMHNPRPATVSTVYVPFPVLRPARERLKVCLLSQDYPPRPCGGIGVWTHTLATGLAQAGHEVTVITRGTEHPTVDFEEGVWVHRIVPAHQPHRRAPLLPDLPPNVTDYAYAVYDEVLRVHSRRGLDVVSSPIWDLEGAACLAARPLPTVLSLHSTYALVLPSKPEWTRDEVYRRAHVDKVIAGEIWALQQADLVMANSDAVVRDIEEACRTHVDREKVVLVPHGVRDVRVPAERADSERDQGPLRLLYVGRLELRKGADLLLEVLPRLLEEFPNLEAVLVGQDDLPVDGASLKQRFLAAHAGQPFLARIRFTGLLPDAELEREYAGCDLFVAPSRYESFGLVYLEAMRHGKPCIGTQAGGIPEVLEDGLNGILVPPGDVVALEEAIRSLLGDPDARRRLGAAARDRFRARFSVERMVSTACRAYRGLLARAVRFGVPVAVAAEDGGSIVPTSVYMGNNRVLTETKQGVRLYLDTRDIVITPIVLLRSEWEPETTAALVRVLRPGMHVVDVGANMGYFTCLIGRLVLPGGKVWAFEADPETFELLTDNVNLNWFWEGVTVEQKAVYSRTGTVTLYSRRKYRGNTSLGATAEADLARTIDSEQAIEVPAVTLDDYFLPLRERIDLVKVDVEGAEPYVLEGMRGLLEAQPEMRLMIEWSPGQMAKTGHEPRHLVEFFRGHRFRAELLGREGSALGWDELANIPLGMLLLSRAAS